jgi:putative acetyltransferase
VVIRREAVEDQGPVDAVISAAFRRAQDDQEPVETHLVRALRKDVGWIPTLSLVALRDDRIVGHVVCTRGWVGEMSALGLGPISVLPEYQRQGIGQALMRTIIDAADASGEPLIALLGDHHFYGRFGFVPASRLGIAAPDPGWGDHFQALPLTECPRRITGAFEYAAPFADL